MSTLSEWRHDIETADRLDRDHLFGLSTYTSGHQEAGVFPISSREIKERIENVMKNVCGKSKWRKVNDTKRNSLKNEFEHGEAVNEILKWYLQDFYNPYRCITETKNNQSEYDLLIEHNDMGYCGIEIKRVGSANQLEDYMGELPKKKHERRDVQRYLLLLLFPITDAMDLPRTYQLLHGYGPLGRYYDDFYSDSSAHIACVPSPVYKLGDINDDGPLEIINHELQNGLDITG